MNLDCVLSVELQDMYNRQLKLTRRAALFALLSISPWTSAQSHNHDLYLVNETGQSMSDLRYLLVQRSEEHIDNVSPPAGRLPPELITRPATSEKKCMVVCASWGEECTYTDRGIGGTSRECRRTCQQFTEECF